MNQTIRKIAVFGILLATHVSLGFSQTSAEPKSFLSQRLGLSQDQIAAIEHDSHSPRTPRPQFG